MQPFVVRRPLQDPMRAVAADIDNPPDGICMRERGCECLCSAYIDVIKVIGALPVFVTVAGMNDDIHPCKRFAQAGRIPNITDHPFRIGQS